MKRKADDERVRDAVKLELLGVPVVRSGKGCLEKDCTQFHDYTSECYQQYWETPSVICPLGLKVLP